MDQKAIDHGTSSPSKSTQSVDLYLRPSTLELSGHTPQGGPPALEDARTLIGVVSGLDHRAAAHLQVLSDKGAPRYVKLVIVLSAACPTTKDVLLDLYEIQVASGGDYEFHLYLHTDNVTSPTNVLWVQRENDDCGTVLIGADQNFLLNAPEATRLTLGLPLSLQQADSLRQWIDLVQGSSTRLSREVCDIPRLVHPEGTEEGRLLWEAYKELLDDQPGALNTVTVDPETGDVTVEDDEGNPVPTLTSSGILTPIDPLKRDLSGVFEKGAIAIVNEASRLPPLRLPLPPTLFEKQGKDTAGTVVRESKYRLNILPDEKMLKEIENAKTRCSTLLRKFSFGMGDAQRWVPSLARPLFEAELQNEDQKGRTALVAAIGGDIEAFIGRQSKRIIDDARTMADQMGRPLSENDPALAGILDSARARLEKAMDGRFAPLYEYNKVIPEIGAKSAHQSGWGHVAAFLTEVARLPRLALTDPYYSRGTELLSKASGLRKYLQAMDVLGDTLVAAYLSNRNVDSDAESDLEYIAYLTAECLTERELCEGLLALIRKPRS
ncbi:hypothetical protein FHR70_003500 [Microvirga lupini]|uniref:Uncharacterized protein n=1 Tax=Microvirga lupini TaxID=420324 RepID=A0A7W4YYK4_9HYPH|nr:hypothetical protein [Microvirga lupini]MBB3020419.1 hypothetical protein [Microvirga lupini]